MAPCCGIAGRRAHRLGSDTSHYVADVVAIRPRSDVCGRVRTSRVEHSGERDEPRGELVRCARAARRRRRPRAAPRAGSAGPARTWRWHRPQSNGPRGRRGRRDDLDVRRAGRHLPGVDVFAGRCWWSGVAVRRLWPRVALRGGAGRLGGYLAARGRRRAGLPRAGPRRLRDGRRAAAAAAGCRSPPLLVPMIVAGHWREPAVRAAQPEPVRRAARGSRSRCCRRCSPCCAGRAARTSSGTASRTGAGTPTRSGCGSPARCTTSSATACR